jgi:hypothetical protein
MMSSRPSHEDYVRSVHAQIVQTAQAMLDGRTSFIVGARRLLALRDESGPASDASDFEAFVIIDSETDELPLGAVQSRWNADSLARLRPDIEEAEQWARETGTSACLLLIEKFSLPCPRDPAHPV